ncbi:hypothetical protein ASPZODRAFT_16829 [Penicilliopsis zonata CBS 506.65]|uniref:Uncharacterized protein n=1 Tax=Penicilliopsis zonata CBS 506.65 TaxID=1073090 RepID=A0A1L9SGQ4_9EURO|nr:hypothetical protein ASPZODRAFT_16829 [Penicilliopsis zonata CBS 506.65]OJJ46234.1 hypothetical protein ASPZODRAFT_16829 [Penicilliopsis zonata CBS 506.65]
MQLLEQAKFAIKLPTRNMEYQVVTSPDLGDRRRFHGDLSLQGSSAQPPRRSVTHAGVSRSSMTLPPTPPSVHSLPGRAFYPFSIVVPPTQPMPSRSPVRDVCRSKVQKANVGSKRQGEE